MQVLRALADCRAACRAAASEGTLGFVPTMGALHEGHLALVRRARAESRRVAVSIFVNPLQFGPGEDFARYPRDDDRDLALLSDADVDLVLLLQRDELYPDGFVTTVRQPELTSILEGAARPGHFDGVLTIVAKLLNIATPTRAYFGQKDYQQTVVVRRMVRDLDLPVEIVVCPTVRDADGLALSSRNVFLQAEQRARALALVRALHSAQDLFDAGQRATRALERVMHAALVAGTGREPDYARILAPDDLSARSVARAGDVALVASPVGATRLIDNHVLGAMLRPFLERA